MMRPKEYPRWKFHRDVGAKIVHSVEEDLNLGPSWIEVYAAQNLLDVAKAQSRYLHLLNAESPKEEKPEKPEKPRSKSKAVIA
jgi:hypothetical protein